MSPKENNVPVVSDIPELMKLWSKVDNPLGLASKTYVNSKNVKATWICTECNRPYSRSVREVYSGKTVCKTCTSRKNAHDYIKKKLASEGSFAENYPERALDWDYENNGDLQPSQFLSKSNEIVNWKCHTCGYKWTGMIANHVLAQYSCKECAYKGTILSRYGSEPLSKTHPELIKKFDESNTVSLYNVTAHDTKTKLIWFCPKGHKWSRTASYMTRVSDKCPTCQKEAQTSFPEQVVYHYLSKITGVKNRFKINKKEIDIFIPELNIGIEYDGRYHHASKESKEKEISKDLFFDNIGIKIFRIKESTINSIEDRIIYYLRDSNYNFLPWAISSLCNMLSLPIPEIDIENDRIEIMEHFIAREKEDSIVKKYPHLKYEWNYQRNGILNPEYFSGGSKRIVWWKCKDGHEWQEAIHARRKYGCPFCAGVRFIPGVGDLQSQRPDLAKEWDFEQNDKKPWEVSANSSDPYWWICSKCNHHWRTSVASRNNGGTGCDECAKEKRLKSRHKTLVNKKGSLAVKNPDLMLDWNWSKNQEIDPYSIPSRVGFNVAWKCHVCGEEWEKSPDQMIGKKLGCPECEKITKARERRLREVKKKGSVVDTHPSILSDWVKSEHGIPPKELTAGSHEKISWTCHLCSHTWVSSLYKRAIVGHKCPKCKGKVK